MKYMITSISISFSKVWNFFSNIEITIVIIYSENAIKIYTMTWNTMQLYILFIFYNIYNQINFFIEDHTCSLLYYIFYFIIFTQKEFRKHRKDIDIIQ